MFTTPENFAELENRIFNLFPNIGKKEISAALYSRKSVIDPAHPGYSMEIQPEHTEEYARERGWKIFRVYDDPAYSGRNSRRPAMRQMIRDIKDGRVNVVVVHRLDRLYRNLESLLQFINFIRRYNVRLVSVTEHIDTETWWGKLVLYVFGAIAEMYIWQVSARTREGKHARAKSGLTNANSIYGYCRGLCSDCKDPNGKGYCPLYGQPDRVESQRGKILVPHPIEHKGVCLIVNFLHRGCSDLEVASLINGKKFRLESGLEVVFRTKGQPGRSLPGPFSRDNIRDIATNPFYVGLVVEHPTAALDMDDNPEQPDQRKKSSVTVNKREIAGLHRGQHQPLYPYELWEANMKLRRQKGNTPGRTDRVRKEYPITGVATCQVCSQMLGKTVGYRGSSNAAGNRYYRCATMQDKASRKEGVVVDVANISEQNDAWDALVAAHKSTIRAEVMEDAVKRLIERMIIPTEWHEKILAYVASDDGMADFETRRRNLKASLNKLKDLYMLGIINMEELQRDSRPLLDQLNDLQPEKSSGAQAILPMIENLPSLWSQMTPGEQRETLKILFAELEFDGTGKLTSYALNPPFDRLLIANEE